MKKSGIACLLLFLGIVMVSCNKEKKGYTIDDIVGEYIFSNAADAFDGLEADENAFLCYEQSLPLPVMRRIPWSLVSHAPMRTSPGPLLMRDITPVLMVRLSRMRTIPLSECRTITVMGSTRPVRVR